MYVNLIIETCPDPGRILFLKNLKNPAAFIIPVGIL